MRILGIETSCDETSAAVVSAGAEGAAPWRLDSNVVASQLEVHREWGGVVPELASRQHLREICGIADHALALAGCAWADIDALAVTQGPGLVGALLVGVSWAKATAWSLGLPVVPVHHLAGHIESIWLAHGDIPLPACVLVVSGGHTSLYLVREPGVYDLVGRTRDDAAGEAYDKVARLLGLGYPGGPVVDRLASTGDPLAVPLPRPRFTGPSRSKPHVADIVEFSFSGLKSAAVRLLQARQAAGPLSEQEVADVCASFQRVVVETLVDRTFEAAERLGARSVGMAGGVSANSGLRAAAAVRSAMSGVPVFIPPVALSTDNAAMIAAAGLRRLQRGAPASYAFNADPALPIGS
jgi:N6-L-threonylcarbamoyladenine synthase